MNEKPKRQGILVQVDLASASAAVPLLEVSFLSPFNVWAFFAAANCQAGMVAALPLPNLLLPDDAVGVAVAGTVLGTPPVISVGVGELFMFVVGEFVACDSADALL